MNDLDIDETLPGQEIEEEIKEEVIRRETDLSPTVNSSRSSLSDYPTDAAKAEFEKVSELNAKLK